MKYYFTYEIKIKNKENSLNGCCYYGKHETKNLDDNYYGSGTIIKSYINKYGTKGLQKTILNFYSNSDELSQAEILLIDEKKEELKEKCLNLNKGGFGSFYYINQTLTEEQKHKNAVIGGNANKIRLLDEKEKQRTHEALVLMHKNMSAEEKKKRYNKVSNSLKKYYNTEVGKRELEERKIKNKMSNQQTSKQWREEFYIIFNATPESFRKYKKQKEVIALYKKIKNLSKEEQKKEIENFLLDIKKLEEIV